MHTETSGHLVTCDEISLPPLVSLVSRPLQLTFTNTAAGRPEALQQTTHPPSVDRSAKSSRTTAAFRKNDLLQELLRVST